MVQRARARARAAHRARPNIDPLDERSSGRDRRVRFLPRQHQAHSGPRRQVSRLPGAGDASDLARSLRPDSEAQLRALPDPRDLGTRHRPRSGGAGAPSRGGAIQVHNDAAAEMPAGSLFLWMGRTLHGAGANRTNQWRFGTFLSYSLGWLRQEENLYLDVPPDIARTLPKELRRLLGYGMHAA